MYKLLFIILISFMSITLLGQSSYNVLFNSSQKDEVGWYVCNDKINNEQIVLVTNECDEWDTCVIRQRIYSINITGDTIRWPFVDRRNDTIFSINNIIQEDNGDYFIVGIGYTENSGPAKKAFDYYSKWNNNHEKIWEKYHQRPPIFYPFMSSQNYKILELKNGNYLVGMSIITFDSILDVRYYFYEVGINDGVVVREKVLELWGDAYLQSLTYNFDSTEVILHSSRIYMPECDRNSTGAVFLDPSTYDTLRTYCYNRDDDDPLKHWCVNIPYNAKLNSDGTMIVAGTGDCSNLSGKFVEHYLFAYKYDTSFNLLERQFLTNQDTILDAAWFESLDINSNNEIFVVGNHNRHIGPWNSQYDYIYIAKLNQNLEILSERYLGGDAYYTCYSMSSTSDGGMVVTGTRFDYLVNDFERDAFVIKTDGNLWVGQQENSQIPVHSAIVYPNPGNHQFSIRTTEYPSSVELFDTYGNVRSIITINQLITNINTSKLNNGLYTWILKKDKIIIDRGKWIKIND